MIVRALDLNGDWTFGAGLNNYKRGLTALAQSIQTRLQSFLGDCFFATNFGIDWFNLLGSKNQAGLELALSTMILNTQNVTGLLQLSVSIDPENRVFTIQYQVATTLGTLTNEFVFDSSSLLAG